MPELNEVIEALRVGPVIFGEDHEKPEARIMAAELIKSKKVRILLIEAAATFNTQKALLKAILSGSPFPGDMANLEMCALHMLKNHDTWIPVMEACYQQGVLVFYADSDMNYKLKVTPEGMDQRNDEMAGHLASVTKNGGAGVLLICGADHTDEVAKKSERKNVKTFRFAA